MSEINDVSNNLDDLRLRLRFAEAHFKEALRDRDSWKAEHDKEVKWRQELENREQILEAALRPLAMHVGRAIRNPACKGTKLVQVVFDEQSIRDCERALEVLKEGSVK